MKILVIQDSFVSGVPIFAGEVLPLNQTVPLPEGNVTVGNGELANLRLANRVVDFADATDEQLALVESRDEAKAEKVAAIKKAAGAKATKVKKPSETQTEGKEAK